MKNYLIYGILGFLLLTGCAKEADLEPNTTGIDWFQIQDKPGTFNRMAYEIYTETGMPIFVNDTLGVEQRGLDAYGNPIMYYEIFKLGYGVFTQLTEADMVLSSDTVAMVKAAELIRDRVIPNLPQNTLYSSYSYLLVDTLYQLEHGWHSNPAYWKDGMKPGYSYKTMMGVVVGQLSDILNMTDDEQSFWSGMIVSASISPFITEWYTEELEDFYAITNDKLDASQQDFYKQIFRYNKNTGVVVNKYYNSECEELGFLQWAYVGNELNMPFHSKQSITKIMDVKDYVAAVYGYTEERFRELYALYPKCINKYVVMKGIVQKFKERADS